MIIYGGIHSTVSKQMKCSHDWHGPCMGTVARFYKCKKCFVIDYDLLDNEESEKKVFDDLGKTISEYPCFLVLEPESFLDSFLDKTS